MARNLARAGAAMVAATVVAGGMTLGVGVASAEGSAGCGSVDLGLACADDNSVEEEVVTHDGFEITYRYPDDATAGYPTTFRITIKNVGHPDRGLTKLVHYPPSGFELTSVTTNRIRHSAVDNRDHLDPIVLDHVHDSSARTVTFTDPSGDPMQVLDGLQFELTYTPRYGYSSQASVGDVSGRSGVTFEGPGIVSPPTPLPVGAWTSTYESGNFSPAEQLVIVGSTLLFSGSSGPAEIG